MYWQPSQFKVKAALNLPLTTCRIQEALTNRLQATLEPEHMPMFCAHVPNLAILSNTSNKPQVVILVVTQAHLLPPLLWFSTPLQKNGQTETTLACTLSTLSLSKGPTPKPPYSSLTSLRRTTLIATALQKLFEALLEAIGAKGGGAKVAQEGLCGTVQGFGASVGLLG